MGIEPGGDQDQLRGEAAEGGKELALHGVAEFLRAGIGLKRRIEDVAYTALIGSAGARIVRSFVQRLPKPTHTYLGKGKIHEVARLCIRQGFLKRFRFKELRNGGIKFPAFGNFHPS